MSSISDLISRRTAMPPLPPSIAAAGAGWKFHAVPVTGVDGEVHE
ncbi:MAG: hypothetical protein QOH05_2598 [Acetobacteraceae bacterium]|jgi:hypothetical protein|nr:hypothetical protein [Acetobacteraceae bacterium]